MVNNMTHADFDTLIKARRILAYEMSDIGLHKSYTYVRLLALAFKSLNGVTDYCQYAFDFVDQQKVDQLSVESEV